jgi:cytochrome c oxidase subunit I
VAVRGCAGDLVTVEARPSGALQARRPFPARVDPKRSLLYKLVTTSDHKLVGIMYNNRESQ